MTAAGAYSAWPYSDRVRAHFATPAHAGDLEGRYPVEVAGEAAESAGGCRVVLSAGIDGGIFNEVRFRVFGCPHLVAAAEEWCRQVEGNRASSRTGPAIAGLMDLLDVPVEKTGRLLVLEDAWAALGRALEREPNTATSDQ